LSWSFEKVKEIQAALGDMLSKELSPVIDALLETGKPDGIYRVDIPIGSYIDKSAEELADIVARTANAFWEAARFSGLVYAKQKLIENRYKIKYKKGLGFQAKNKEEREANAIAYAEEEAIELSLVEAIAEYAQRQENAARVASESARKIFDKVQSMNVAQTRQGHGWGRD
jgi:hypothetical protein